MLIKEALGLKKEKIKYNDLDQLASTLTEKEFQGV